MMSVALFNGQKGGTLVSDGQLWAVRGQLEEMTEACKSAEEWCRGTESNCRHQPFQGLRKTYKINLLNEKDNAKSNILYQGKTMS